MLVAKIEPLIEASTYVTITRPRHGLGGEELSERDVNEKLRAQLRKFTDDDDAVKYDKF